MEDKKEENGVRFGGHAVPGIAGVIGPRRRAPDGDGRTDPQCNGQTTDPTHETSSIHSKQTSRRPETS